MEETEYNQKQQASMFENLLHKIQMDLGNTQPKQQGENFQDDNLSIREYSLNSIKSSPRRWAFDQEESFEPAIQQMIDFLTLQQDKQLQRIQISRMDQQQKIGTYLSHHRIKIKQDFDTSHQKHLKENLNLSPRKKKIIEKERIKIPKFKLQ